MDRVQDIEQFNSLCQKHKVWVISYSSPQRQTTVFMIWYTDTDEDRTDRLLTDLSGEIVAVESLTNLIGTLQKELANLTPFEELVPWLDSVKGLYPFVQCGHDTEALITSITNKNLDIPTLEGLVNWINLFTDFAYQDTRNSYLFPYRDDRIIKKAWDYMYEYIFWPRYTDKVKFETLYRPPLITNTPLLVEKLLVTINAFEARIHVVETPEEPR